MMSCETASFAGSHPLNPLTALTELFIQMLPGLVQERVRPTLAAVSHVLSTGERRPLQQTHAWTDWAVDRVLQRWCAIHRDIKWERMNPNLSWGDFWWKAWVIASRKWDEQERLQARRLGIRCVTIAVVYHAIQVRPELEAVIAAEMERYSQAWLEAQAGLGSG